MLPTYLLTPNHITCIHMSVGSESSYKQRNFSRLVHLRCLGLMLVDSGKIQQYLENNSVINLVQDRGELSHWRSEHSNYLKIYTHILRTGNRVCRYFCGSGSTKLRKSSRKYIQEGEFEWVQSLLVRKQNFFYFLPLFLLNEQ